MENNKKCLLPIFPVPLPCLSLIDVQHGCVVWKTLWSWFFGSCGSRYQPHATTNKAQGAPSFIGFHKHLLLEGTGLKFVFPWILVCVFSEADRIPRLKELQGSRKAMVSVTGNHSTSRNPALLWVQAREREIAPFTSYLEGLSYLSLIFLLCSILSLEDQWELKERKRKKREDKWGRPGYPSKWKVFIRKSHSDGWPWGKCEVDEGCLRVVVLKLGWPKAHWAIVSLDGVLAFVFFFLLSSIFKTYSHCAENTYPIYRTDSHLPNRQGGPQSITLSKVRIGSL